MHFQGSRNGDSLYDKYNQEQLLTKNGSIWRELPRLAEEI